MQSDSESDNALFGAGFGGIPFLAAYGGRLLRLKFGEQGTVVLAMQCPQSDIHYEILKYSHLLVRGQIAASMRPDSTMLQRVNKQYDGS